MDIADAKEQQGECLRSNVLGACIHPLFKQLVTL
jgi:hypothetical protein